MSVDRRDQDPAEWDQAAFWQFQPDSTEAYQPDPAALETDRSGVIRPSAAPSLQQRARAALRALPVARLRSLPHDILRRVRSWRQLVPVRIGVVTGAGFTFVSLMVLSVVVGSVVWISYQVSAPVASPEPSASPVPTGPAPVTGDPAPGPPDSGPPPEITPTPSPSRGDGPSTGPRTGANRRGSTQPKSSTARNSREVASPSPRAVRAFRLASSITGKSIGVASGSTADGAGIVQVSGQDNAQQWRMVHVGSGYYNLINVKSGKALDNPNGSQDNGTQMQQWTIWDGGNANQQWRFESAGDGFYLVINRASGRALDLRDSNNNDGAPIQQWEPASKNPNQRWRIAVVQ